MTSLTDLPFEVVLNVVAHLDNNSIANFLHAFPSLKKEAILITDHHFEPIHFDIDGIHRAYLPNKCPHHMDLEMYDKFRHRQPIKLVELFYAEESLSLCLLGDDDTGLPADAQVLSLDSHCFIHARAAHGGIGSTMTSFSRVDRLGVGCKTSIGLSRHLKQYGYGYRHHFKSTECDADVVISTVAAAAPCFSTKSFEWIKSLTVSEVTTFTVHSFPLLTDLKITFSMSETSPSLSRISAPQLQALSITYGDVFPVIDISVSEVLSCDDTSDISVKRNGLFPSFELLCIGASFQSEEIESIISKCDLTYLTLCKIVHFSGVHSKVIKACDLSTVEDFYWDVLHHEEDINDIGSLDIPELSRIVVTVNADESCLPIITCRRIYSVILTLMVPSVDFFGFLMSLNGSVSILRIYRSLFAQQTCQSHAILTFEEWDQFMTLNTERLDRLELVGFEIPFLQAKNTLKKVSYCLYNLRDVVLMPVMTKSDFSDKDQFCLDGFRLKAMRAFVFEFSPIMLNSDATFAASRRSILLDVGFQYTSLWDRYTITCSPIFKDYYLQGLKRFDDGVPAIPVMPLLDSTGHGDQTMLENTFPGVTAACGLLTLSTSTSPLWETMMEYKYHRGDSRSFLPYSEGGLLVNGVVVKHSWCGRHVFLCDFDYRGRMITVDYSPLFKVSTLRGTTNYGLHGDADFPPHGRWYV